MPLRAGMPVGDAIRELVHHGSRPRPMKQIVAIAENNHGRGIAHRDMGGGIAAGGIPITQQPAASQTPFTQSRLQQFGQVPDEKLQQLAVQYGNSPQGQLARQVLQARRMGQAKAPAQPQANAPAAPMSPAPQQPAMRRGGGIAHRAFGGDAGGISVSEGSPWWERAEERGEDSGFLRGSTMGRADHLMATAPSGAYIIPADVIAGLGEGNSLAGARVVDDMLTTGPWGTRDRAPRTGRPAEARAHSHLKMLDGGEGGEYRGGGGLRAGGVKGPGIGGSGKVPVALSHGEYHVGPEDVRRIGGGNIKLGHSRLDAWVVRARKEQIEKLKKLKPPVGSKAA